MFALNYNSPNSKKLSPYKHCKIEDFENDYTNQDFQSLNHVAPLR